MQQVCVAVTALVELLAGAVAVQHLHCVVAGGQEASLAGEDGGEGLRGASLTGSVSPAHHVAE